jgi:4-amino-4-deoxy-L-arabinose transferase-like glycosyltransferase
MVKKWTRAHSYAVLIVLTLASLIPFSAKPFHTDDPLFVWTAQQIVHNPLDPYGFQVVWYTSAMPMWEVTKNPPLSCYYIAAVALVAGWSEQALHIAFLLPALAVVLGTYRLARRFTRSALLAGAATLLAPGFLVSSTNLMCDTMMLALWMAAVILWLEGLDTVNPWLLAGSGFVISLCALTKYFGMALIPLLLAYSLVRKRRLGVWALYLLIPVATLAGYQYWTHSLYGRGLLWDAVGYAHHENVKHGTSKVLKVLVGLAFAGGCALTPLTCAPWLWSRRKVLLGFAFTAVLGMGCAVGLISVAPANESSNWICAQFAIFVGGGISIFALAIGDCWKRRGDADSVLLALWVLGTLVFAACLNWTVNARSVLPLIPAASILLARRVDEVCPLSRPERRLKFLIPLSMAGVISLWVAWADVKLADSAREAATYVQEHVPDPSRVSFAGHWGFQYYMQSLGFNPVDSDSFTFQDGDLVVIPENNSNAYSPQKDLIASRQLFEFDINPGAATMQRAMGAGFYTDLWGPLPYAFGSVPPERYVVVRLRNR